MTVLGLIAARGGSKGVPRKNIRRLGGRPLIAWAIETGLAVDRIDRVVVTTDDEEIASVAREWGADVPFLRPAELATDAALQIDAISHAVQELEETGGQFDVVALLQPTVPLRSPADVDDTLNLLERSGADSAITVAEVGGFHPRTYYTRTTEGLMDPMLPSPPEGVRRQDFSTYYWRTGAVYAVRRDVLLEQRSLYGSSTVGHVVPMERSFNIDSEFDWMVTEAWLAYQSGQAGGP